MNMSEAKIHENEYVFTFFCDPRRSAGSYCPLGGIVALPRRNRARRPGLSQLWLRWDLRSRTQRPSRSQ